MPDKSSLRKKFTDIRSSISPAEQKILSLKAAENFFQKIKINNGDVVAAYYPINNEISPLPILEKLQQLHIQTALPIIVKNSPLLFRQWQVGDALEGSKIPQPLANAPQIIPTIIIVPLLAFDKTNNRLGYGGGYYDRTIERLNHDGHKITTVGLAYSSQKYDGNLPNEAHDQPLDLIVAD